MDFQQFLHKLDKEGKLVHVTKPVSTKYGIAAIMKKFDGKPILFENVSNSSMKVAANVLSSRELLADSLGINKDDVIEKVANAIDRPSKPVEDSLLYDEYEVVQDLFQLPILTYYAEDGGPYIASSIFVVNDRELGINASYHRMMVLDKDKVVARVLPRHFEEFVKRGNKEFAICIGLPPSMAVASAISCELEKSELDIANAISPIKVFELDSHIVPESEIIMIAEITDERVNEGPFMDLTETFDIVRQERLIKIKKIYKKKDAVFHALLPGGDEHKMLMGTPKEPAIYRAVNKVCKCRNVYITPGGCSWLHAIVQIEKHNEDDGRKAIEAAFEGHKSLKRCIIVDSDIDITNPHEVEWAIATRFQASKGLVVKEKQIGSSLDPSANPVTRETTKVGIDATAPVGKISEFSKHKIPGEDRASLE
ncbi:MAG: UbiD family decarboxylase [Candidatus Aenigmatarchaeota archaeon]